MRAGNQQGQVLTCYCSVLCVSQAKEVRDMLDGTIIDGRPLAVRLRTERKEDRGPREGGRGPPGAPVPGAARVVVVHMQWGLVSGR